ncbi:MAG: HEPN domain-containing protein [Deferrisomatales bacterium]
MLRTGRYLYVGFMCHQAVEKAMKACYQKREGRVPPRTHNLLVLASATELLNRMTERHKDLLTELEPLAVEARYPEHKERMRQLLDGGFSSSLLDRTREILEWIRNELSR